MGEQRECPVCGKAFSPRNRNHYICSDACRRSSLSGIYQAKRAAALKRDNYSCTECGETSGLCCHHIKPRCLGGDHRLDNLQTLCKPCHKRKHRKGWMDEYRIVQAA